MAKHGKIPDWYDKGSEFEELFHKDTTNEKVTNRTIEKILKKHRVKTVLDLTCGTGSQVFHLLKCGFKVTGSDISKGMLKIAERKAKICKLVKTVLTESSIIKTNCCELRNSINCL